MKNWNASEAKIHFSQVLENSAAEPQTILKHGKPVSVVVSYPAFKGVQDYPPKAKSTSEWLEELIKINRHEEDMPEPERSDRRQPDWESGE
jgi:prevent-host-death family protein